MTKIVWPCLSSCSNINSMCAFECDYAIGRQISALQLIVISRFVWTCGIQSSCSFSDVACQAEGSIDFLAVNWLYTVLLGWRSEHICGLRWNTSRWKQSNKLPNQFMCFISIQHMQWRTAVITWQLKNSLFVHFSIKQRCWVHLAAQFVQDAVRCATSLCVAITPSLELW